MGHYKTKNSNIFSQEGPARMFPWACCGSRWACYS